jgi:hypothetical protein
MNAVTTALHSATEQVQAGSQAVGLCAIKQAEEGTALLFNTLRDMASTRDPSALASLYSQYLTRSAEQNAQQLQELAEILAAQSRESWEPIAKAIQSATQAKSSGR